MVKIHALLILKTDATADGKPLILCGHVEGLSGVAAWLYRDSVREFVVFFSKLMAEKTLPGYRQQITKDQFVGYVHARTDGLSGVLVTDETYPVRVAFDVVRQALHDFTQQYPPSSSTALSTSIKSGKDFCVPAFNEPLRQLMDRYQDPSSSDKLLKIQKDLGETKEILGQALDKLLDRGQSLESLIDQSDALSMESKAFYRRARQAKGCC